MSAYAITTESEQALAAAVTETLVQLVGATGSQGRLRKWGVSFDGVTSDAQPVIVELVRQSTAGTSSAATVAKLNPNDGAAQCTGRRAFSGTEPTTTDILEQHEVHPQGGGIVQEYPPDESAPTVSAATTSRLGIRCTAPATVNCVAFIHFTE